MQQTFTVKHDYLLDPRSVGQGRRLVADFCDLHGLTRVRADAIATASELLGNVVKHVPARFESPTKCTLFVAYESGLLEIGVWDPVPGPCPKLRHPSEIEWDFEGGRGLAMIRAEDTVRSFLWKSGPAGKRVSVEFWANRLGDTEVPRRPRHASTSP